MSAFMVDREHISYLLDAAMYGLGAARSNGLYWYHDSVSHRLQPGDNDRAAEVGQMLWDANRQSIEARYPDTVGSDEHFSETAPGVIGETYRYDRHAWNMVCEFSAVQVIKAAKCFAYQSCEFEGWGESEAKAFIDALINAAICELPGYDDAAWGAPETYVNACN